MPLQTPLGLNFFIKPSRSLAAQRGLCTGWILQTATSSWWHIKAFQKR